MNGGTFATNAKAPVQLAGSYTQTATGTTLVRLGSQEAGLVSTLQAAALAGTLNITFQTGFAPKAGDTITVLRAAQVHGRFDNVTVAGFKATPVYLGDSVQVQLSAAN